MNMSKYREYKIRDATVKIDTDYESNIGIYGDPFWREIANGTYIKSFWHGLWQECFLCQH